MSVARRHGRISHTGQNRCGAECFSLVPTADSCTAARELRIPGNLLDLLISPRHQRRRHRELKLLAEMFSARTANIAQLSASDLLPVTQGSFPSNSFINAPTVANRSFLYSRPLPADIYEAETGVM
jgi:hypothetical protein